MKKEIQITVNHLIKGDIILCPTDTIWGLSCDATNKIAVDNIYKIKKRDKSKSLIILVSSKEMLMEYTEDLSIDIDSILSAFSKPLTIIYPKAINLADNVFASDNSIAIRIVKTGFIHELISLFGKPIVSTSANYSNQVTALSYKDINQDLKDEVNFSVNEQFGNSLSKSSTIIKLVKEGFITLRP